MNKNTKDIVLIGAGGLGREAAALIERINYYGKSYLSVCHHRHRGWTK